MRQIRPVRCLSLSWRLILLLLLAISQATNAAPGKLEVKFFNVGQADAVFIRCPDARHQLLIDSGDSRYPAPLHFQRHRTGKKMGSRTFKLRGRISGTEQGCIS